MLPDRVSNPGPLTYESGALPIALRGPAHLGLRFLSLLRRPINSMCLFIKVLLNVVIFCLCKLQQYSVLINVKGVAAFS